MPAEPEIDPSTPRAPTPTEVPPGTAAPDGPGPTPPAPGSPGSSGPPPWSTPAVPGPRGTTGPTTSGPPGPVGGYGMPLVGSAVTLILGAVVGGVLYATADAPSGFLTGRLFQVTAISLGLMAAPVALLLSWDEIDVSSIGAVSIGGYLYAEVNEESVLPGLAVAALVGLAIGAAIGLVRWLTGAHSALVSVGAGALASGTVAAIGPGTVGLPTRGVLVDGVVLPSFLLLVVAGLAVGLAALSPTTTTPTSTARSADRPGPIVVPAFALSGLATGLFGALLAGSQGFYLAGQGAVVTILLFTAVAVGGVVRGSGVAAPIVAAVGAVIAVLAHQSSQMHGWNRGESDVALGALLVVCAALASGIRRLLAPPARPPSAF